MLVSVCICTWNRADLLDRTLAEMRHLRIPHGVEWELLVVNNRCTDHTDDVIERHSGHLPIRRLFEPKQGHSHARNCAVDAAAGELILWTDDDVLVDPHWMEAYVDASRRWPAVVAFGGRVDPWFEEPPPTWLAENMDLLGSAFALRDLGASERVLDDTSDQVPYGANMAFAAAELRNHRFDPRLGRQGERQVSGDDADIFRRIIRDGRQVLWVPSASVKHFLPKSRVSLEYLRRLYYDGGRYPQSEGSIASGRYFANVPFWVFKRALKCEFSYIKFRVSSPPRSWLPLLMKRSASRGIFAYYLAQSRKLRGRKRPSMPEPYGANQEAC